MLKPQQALSATRHDLSRVSRCLLTDIYVRVYIYIYIYVRMYKTVSLLTANTVGHSHYNKFLCVCCKKSFNVCGFNKSLHTTENI